MPISNIMSDKASSAHAAFSFSDFDDHDESNGVGGTCRGEGGTVTVTPPQPPTVPAVAQQSLHSGSPAAPSRSPPASKRSDHDDHGDRAANHSTWQTATSPPAKVSVSSATRLSPIQSPTAFMRLPGARTTPLVSPLATPTTPASVGMTWITFNSLELEKRVQTTYRNQLEEKLVEIEDQNRQLAEDNRNLSEVIQNNQTTLQVTPGDLTRSPSDPLLTSPKVLQHKPSQLFQHSPSSFLKPAVSFSTMTMDHNPSVSRAQTGRSNTSEPAEVQLLQFQLENIRRELHAKSAKVDELTMTVKRLERTVAESERAVLQHKDTAAELTACLEAILEHQQQASISTIDEIVITEEDALFHTISSCDLLVEESTETDTYLDSPELTFSTDAKTSVHENHNSGIILIGKFQMVSFLVTVAVVAALAFTAGVIVVPTTRNKVFSELLRLIAVTFLQRHIVGAVYH